MKLRASNGVLVLGVVALPLFGCASDRPETDDDVALVTGALVPQTRINAAGSGTTYSNQCKIDWQVPAPPDFHTGTLGGNPGQWTFQGTFNDSFVFNGNPADVYTSRSVSPNPPGMCVIAAHYDNTFDVICQGTNGKACFWEDPNRPPGVTSTPVKIVGSGSTFQGGTALTLRCTTCHGGQNAFITHKSLYHPLNQNEVFTEWKPSVWYTPIIPSSWPHGNPGPVTPETPAGTGYPSQCLACHKTNLIGGALPALQMKTYRPATGINGFCKILHSVVSRPASLGGMPPGVADCTPGNNCPLDNDQQVKDMMKACGATFPLLPTIAGIGSPGAGTGQLATKKHHSASAAGWHSHYFYGATTTMPKTGCCSPHQNSHTALKSGDEINVSVFMPEDDKPTGIVISVDRVGGNSYFAYWGPVMNPSPGVRIGSLPDAGAWQVLKFKPSQIGLPNNSVLNGAGFNINNGSAFFADMLFRSSDSPYNLQYVSQVWFQDAAPAPQLTGADGGDSWDFDYPPPIQ